jgi:hypothetical protein
MFSYLAVVSSLRLDLFGAQRRHYSKGCNLTPAPNGNNSLSSLREAREKNGAGIKMHPTANPFIKFYCILSKMV